MKEKLYINEKAEIIKMLLDIVIKGEVDEDTIIVTGAILMACLDDLIKSRLEVLKKKEV